MVLKGLHYYDITEVDGEIRAWSLHAKRNIVRTNNPRPGYRLIVDGKLRFFSDGHLRFLMKHPEVCASTITPRSHRISFNDDGTVRDYYGASRACSYNCFESLEDALSTVLLLMAATEGNMIPVARFVSDSRARACIIVARMMRTTPKRVSSFLEDGEKIFYEQLQSGKVHVIQPLFAWLCKCIRMAMIKKKGMVSIDAMNLDRTLLLSVNLPEINI